MKRCKDYAIDGKYKDLGKSTADFKVESEIQPFV